MIARPEKIPGTRDIAQRIVNARRSFVESLAELGAISTVDAERVADLYLKRKLAKTDAVGGRVNVRHGAYLDRDVIRRAAAL
jgi:predicted phage-related endonuclease